MLKLSIARVCVCVCSHRRGVADAHKHAYSTYIFHHTTILHDSKKIAATIQQHPTAVMFSCAQGTQHQNLPGCLAASSSDKQWTDGAKRRPPLHPAPSARPETTTNPQGTLKTMRDNETEWDSMRHNERRSAIGDRIGMTWISWVDVEGFKVQSCWVCSPSLSSRSHWMSQVHNTS